MRRGDFLTIVSPGAHGKPRPALVVQADAFAAIPSVTVLPLTSEIHDEGLVRITVQPTRENGLRMTSQVMVDKAITTPRTKVGEVIGRVDEATLHAVGVALGRFLGLS